MAVTTRLETIDPRKAQKFLDTMGPNRPTQLKASQRIADAIQNGEWEVNGETIKFDDEGRMIDGAHRCLAVTLAGKGIKTFVTHGLNKVSFDTIDTGRKRTVGDVFAKHGEENCNMLAAAVAWLYRFQLKAVQCGGRITPTHRQSMAILAENPSLRDSCIWGQRCKRFLPSSVTAVLHYLFAKKDQEDAEFFFEHLATGEELSRSSTKTSAIHVLRARLEDNRASLTKLPASIVIAITIKAWNAMRSKRVVKTLRLTKGGDKPEDFPEIQ